MANLTMIAFVQAIIAELDGIDPSDLTHAEKTILRKCLKWLKEND